MQITVAVSKFGFGHLTRQFALCEEIKNIDKDIKFRFVVSEPHEEVFKQYFDSLRIDTFSQFISPSFTMKNPAEIDIESSLYSYQMAVDFDTQIRNDTGWGQVLEGTDILINDIEFFHNPIAKKMGIPIVNISNFTWSDILEPHATPILTQSIMKFEQFSDLNIKLPFATNCTSFGDQYEEFGLLVRRVNNQKADQIRSKFDENLPLILVSSTPPIINSFHNVLLELSQSYNILLTSSMAQKEEFNSTKNILTLPDNAYDIQNYIKAANLVIGKTGYGLVSECASTSTPLLYWTREGFLEDSILSEGLKNLDLGIEFDQTVKNNITNSVAEIINNRGKSMKVANHKIAERILKLR